MDKSFETLYKIAMAMADTCLINQAPGARFDKLCEEFDELVEERKLISNMKTITKEQHDAFLGELSDVLFVLLHIAHGSGSSAFELLHMATTKMLSRMNDPEYIAKN